jgi:O-methyltransferase involved in polyketide biosynthesis
MMNVTPSENSPKRDFSSITPSAKQLLLLKGYSTIPFARQAAQLMLYPKTYMADLSAMDFPFKARLMHFEARYRSIDQLLEGLSIRNMLELSSGFSFRGLHLIQQTEVHYIDTDLPEMVEMKKKFIEALAPQNSNPPGKLETRALNALDENQFQETIQMFPPGQVAILTEGLLMYLNVEEKKKLCAIIRGVLQQRGGYWIVADIYVRRQIDLRYIMVTDALQNFYQAHNIEENKFESFEAAEKFFNDEGLVIDQQADNDYSKLSSWQNLFGHADMQQTGIINNASQVRATWRLKTAQ